MQDEEWEGSIYKGDVIVWAKDEKEAREVANCRFDKAARHPTRTLCSPWLVPALVECVQLGVDGPPLCLILLTTLCDHRRVGDTFSLPI
jgi:hypothetical protein